VVGNNAWRRRRRRSDTCRSPPPHCRLTSALMVSSASGLLILRRLPACRLIHAPHRPLMKYLYVKSTPAPRVASAARESEVRRRVTSLHGAGDDDTTPGHVTRHLARPTAPSTHPPRMQCCCLIHSPTCMHAAITDRRRPTSP